MSTSALQLPIMRDEAAYAGFWRRLLAYLIDSVFLFGVQFLLVIGVVLSGPVDLGTLLNAAIVASLIGWAYFTILESSPGRGTLGKMALGLYVGDLDRDPITFKRALLRNFLKSFSWLLLGSGFVLIAFTPRKQGLHDVLAGTLVMRKVRYFVLGPEVPRDPGDHWDGARWVASVPPVEET
ncbi:MAG TPA: RDD family protein [Candidatus Dormibacteraeota bacterium]|nr:RDD family protein [Candidatus Dormibacteraeota bacterium]